MKFNWQHRLLMDQTRSLADDGGGASGGDTADVSAAAVPDVPPAPVPDVPAKAAAFALPDNWKETLPDDLKNDPSMGVVHDLEGLAKSYVNAQKMIGKDKLVIPDQHASEEDWNKVMQKLGLPEKFEDYKVDLAEDAGLDADFVKSFSEHAHKSGMLPKHAKAVLDWYVDSYKGVVAESTEAAKAKSTEQWDALSQEWGSAYDTHALAGKVAIKDFADEKTMNWLKESGLIEDPNMMRFASKIGMSLKEGEIRGGIQKRGGDNNRYAPEDAQRKYNDILANNKHPYYDKAHPNHGSAVKEVNSLFQMAFPETE